MKITIYISVWLTSRCVPLYRVKWTTDWKRNQNKQRRWGISMLTTHTPPLPCLTLKFCNNKADEGILSFSPGLWKLYHPNPSHNLCLFRIWLRKANTYTCPLGFSITVWAFYFTVLQKMLFVKLKICELCRGGSLRFGENNTPGQATWHCFFWDTFCSGKMS